ncbi:unnamed protein product [Medioppia subpectinata]|uniref:Uncharacterized protein n=1 Tax=Medioppia subpectinata TaxID=1979941 RepID=A0A7R9LLD7_9ACAR|nr:unnamed protein product [Medioppia subpectinata]CAD7642619.1 unnamed protein product [Medioppia subpectinata]CAG2112454.1 unnamed protein product [Medioppia subpectinata]CAG2119286.1 unnamed protein product [Medioppia subpectinata]
MAQGKLKVKAKLPPNAKQHSVHRGVNRISKAPKKPKKLTATQLLQKEVTKSINRTIEGNCRQKAEKEGKSLVTKTVTDDKTTK